MNIRVDLNYTIKDGTEVVFRSPVDCSQVTGLKVYYTENGITTSKEFAFADAHGNNVGDIPHLFAQNVVVKVILDVTSGMAFVQNADTNAYIERTFIKTVNGVAPDENGNVVVEGGSAESIPSSAEVDTDTKIATFRNSAGVALFTLDLSGIGISEQYGNLVLSADVLTIDEGGSATFTVVLESAPNVDQPVYLAVSDNSKLSVSPAVLTFTPRNYDTPQTVTVTALQDEDEYDESITVNLTSKKVDARQVLVNIGDDDKVKLVTDGLVLHFDYRGHQDDTSTTITDLASGVTANNFDKFGKTANGVNGGDNNAKYVYLTLKTTDDPFAAFLSAMKNGQGFTLESFGTVCKRSFYFGNKQLYEFGGGSYFGIGEIIVNSVTQAVCVLADGTSSNTTVTMNKTITIDGTTLNIGTAAQCVKVPNWNNFLHVVTTYSPDGTIRRYFNGYGVDESTTIENFASWDYDTMFAASASHLPAMTGTNQLGNVDGSRYLSSQRVYNRVLTEDEIRMNMAVEASKMGLTTF